LDSFFGRFSALDYLGRIRRGFLDHPKSSRDLLRRRLGGSFPQWGSSRLTKEKVNVKFDYWASNLGMGYNCVLELGLKGSLADEGKMGGVTS